MLNKQRAGLAFQFGNQHKTQFFVDFLNFLLKRTPQNKVLMGRTCYATKVSGML